MWSPPICIDKSNTDPARDEKLAGLESTPTYQRRDALMKTGWATMPGMTEPNRDLATACAQAIKDATS